MHIEQKMLCYWDHSKEDKTSHIKQTQPQQKRPYCMYLLTCGKNANVDQHIIATNEKTCVNDS
jgi:hypothetical protein